MYSIDDLIIKLERIEVELRSEISSLVSEYSEKRSYYKELQKSLLILRKARKELKND